MIHSIKTRCGSVGMILQQVSWPVLLLEADSLRGESPNSRCGKIFFTAYTS